MGTPNRLTLSKADDFKLMSKMVAELATAKSVNDFVAEAKEQLGIANLNKDHIYFRAKELGLTLPDQPRTPRADTAALEARVATLEDQLLRLAERFRDVAKSTDQLASYVVDLKTDVAAFKLAMKYHK